VLDEGINEEEKKNYFDHEVDHFFHQAIDKDIEQSNLRLEFELLSSVQQVDFLSE